MLSQLTNGVWVFHSELLQNNTTVIQGNQGVLVVDPGTTIDEITGIARDLRDAGSTVVAGFHTHPDWDHVLWHADLGAPPRYGTTICAQKMREVRSNPGFRDDVLNEFPPEMDGNDFSELYGIVEALPAGTQTIPWDGPTVHIFEHQGHSPGHAMLLDREHRLLIAGDILSDLFIPMLDFTARDPIGDYVHALDLVEQVVDEVDFFVPGHGNAGDAPELRRRITLERSYLQALHDGTDPNDPRVQHSPESGFDWLNDMHTSQARQYAEHSAR